MSNASADVAMWARHMRAREVLRWAAEALGPDAELMPLKGVLLAALGIVDPAERPISDVDVIVSGVSLPTAAARLAQRGFGLADVPLARGYLSLAAPARGYPSLDLHTRLLPLGLGTLSVADLKAGSTRRADLFGFPVAVPSMCALAAHSLANIIKDHVVKALPHNAEDLAALLRRLTPAELTELAALICRVSLRDAACLALVWSHARTGDAHIALLLEKLLPHGLTRAQLTSRLRAWSDAPSPPLLQRLQARAMVDARSLRILALLGAGYDLATWPGRRLRIRRLFES